MNQPTTCVGLAIATIVVAADVSAQPGSISISPASAARYPLHPYADTMQIVLVRNGERRSGGRFVETLAETRRDGRRAYLAITHDLSPTGVSTFDTLAVDAATLAPLWHRSHAPTDSASVTFDDTLATGYAAHEKQPISTVHFRLSGMAFDAALVRWVYPALPVQPIVVLQSFNIWDNNTQTAVTYRIIGSDTLELRDGRTDAWIVQKLAAGDEKAVRLEWIDKVSHRVLKSRDPLRTAPAADGYWKISSLVKAPNG